MTFVAGLIVLLLLTTIALDRLVCAWAHWFARVWPGDMCGPDGWLVDTRNGNGVFDRPRGRG